MYIVEYEQSGKDRANYGETVIKEIAKKLKNSKYFSTFTYLLILNIIPMKRITAI